MAEECEKNALFECNNWFALIIYFMVAAMVLILLLVIYAVMCNLFGSRFARQRFKSYGKDGELASSAGTMGGRSTGSMAPPPYHQGSSSEALPPYNPQHGEPSSGRTTPSKYSVHTGNGSQYGGGQGGGRYPHYPHYQYPPSVHSGARSQATSSVGGHNRSIDISSVSLEYNTAV